MAHLQFNDTIYNSHLNCLCDDCTDKIADRLDGTDFDDYDLEQWDEDDARYWAEDDDEGYWSDTEYWASHARTCRDPHCADCMAVVI